MTPMMTVRKAFIILMISAMTWITAPGAGAQTAAATYPVFDYLTYSLTIPGVLIYGAGVSYDVTLSLRDAYNGYFLLTGLVPSRSTQPTAVYIPNRDALYMPVVGITDGTSLYGIRDAVLYALSANPVVFGMTPPSSSSSSSSNNGCGNMSFDDCLFASTGMSSSMLAPSVPW